ncbi:MAG TPA: alcohol dehydrogenase catalytic domain-containing protein, partial [Euzebya sp.]|nr:alcohol dehydrogenase catalytic domain-containing protein [Euzebya sp.]
MLEVREVDKPTPNDDELLISVGATTVTSAEAAMRRGRPLWGRLIVGFVRPRTRMRTPGIEFAGEIESVGEGVTRFAAGHQV